MRITHIISSPGAGGAEVYVKDLACAMAAAGHTVRLLFLNRAADIGRDTEYEAKFLDELAQGGVEFGFIGYRARRNPLYGMKQVRRDCKAFAPDVVHCHLYYGAVFCLALPDTKVVYTHHNIKLFAPPWLYKFLDWRVSAYVGICEACTSLLQEVAGREVVRIDNAVATHRLMPRGLRPDINPAPCLLAVGRLAPGKNLKLLFDALALLCDLPFFVTIAGEGPERAELEAQVKRLGIEDRVTFLGNCHDVPQLMNQADIFVMSSAYEGLPIALIEATLTGLPVVVTDVGGCGEVLRHARNGYVVTNPTPERYAAALRPLLESHDLRARFARNAAQNSDRYRLETAVEAHLSLYTRLTAPSWGAQRSEHAA